MGGAGYYAGKKVAENQYEDDLRDQVAYQPTAAPPPAPVGETDTVAQLHDQGILSDEEFAASNKRCWQASSKVY